MAIDDQEDDVRLHLGPAGDAVLLEVGTIVRGDGSELAIHAMRLRAKGPTTASRWTRMARNTCGNTKNGIEITDELVERLAEKAEAGHDVDEILRRCAVESVRLDPELQQALTDRAARHHETTSSVIHKALRQYLAAC